MPITCIRSANLPLTCKMLSVMYAKERRGRTRGERRREWRYETDFQKQFRGPDGKRYKIKAGIHCGKVVAGVIGTYITFVFVCLLLFIYFCIMLFLFYILTFTKGIYKFSYDLWGDTVNTASRMESHSLPGQIQVTEAVQKKLANRFEFADRGFIQVKKRGKKKGGKFKNQVEKGDVLVLTYVCR